VHKSHENTHGIKNAPDGLDFFFSAENHARKMVDFLQNVLPVKFTQPKKMISHDIHSNSYNYKFMWLVEIVSISKGSLVCLNKKLQQQHGSIAPLYLVQNVANTVHLLEPQRAQLADISCMNCFQYPFAAICNPQQLVEYTEIIGDRKQFPKQGTISFKHVTADEWLVKSSELGLTDSQKPIAFKIISSCTTSKLFVYLLIITGLPSASAKRTMNFSSEEDCPTCLNIWVFVLLLLAGFICLVFKRMKKPGVNVETQVNEENFKLWDLYSGFKY
jgi:NMD3 family